MPAGIWYTLRAKGVSVYLLKGIYLHGLFRGKGFGGDPCLSLGFRGLGVLGLVFLCRSMRKALPQAFLAGYFRSTTGI